MRTAPHQERWPLGAALAIFALAFAFLAWPWLSGAVTIPWDAKAQFYPQLTFLAQSLARGEAPFWTPFVFGGWPQIADPQSLIFSPAHLVLAFFNADPSFFAADAVTFALLFTGGVGVLLLFRERGWHPAGAIVAALAFSFGGSAASRIQHTGQIASLALLPVALWLLASAMRRRSGLRGAAAGLVIAAIALGRDQVALLSLYVLAGFVAAYWLDGPDRLARMRATLIPLAGAAAIAAALIALPALLTMLLALDSNRPAIDYLSAGRGSLHPAHLLTLLFADLYGAADPTVDYWGPPSFAWGPTDLFLAQNMGQLYLGALPVIAILSSALRGELFARDIRFFTIAALLACLYALGWYTPFFRAALEIIPGVSLFRRPADATFVACALAAIVAGYAIHVSCRQKDPLAGHKRLSISIVCIAAALLAALVLAARADMLAEATKPLATGALWLAAASLLATYAPQIFRRIEHAWAGASRALAALPFALFMTLDFDWNNAPNESTGLPPAYYDAMRRDTANETIALLRSRLATSAAPDRRDRVELPAIGYHWPNISLIHGFDHTLGHNPLRLAAFARAVGAEDTIAMAEQRTFTPLFPSYRSMLADLLGLRYIASGAPIEQIDSALKPGDLPLIARTADAFIYENPRALPRVLVVEQWRRADFKRMMIDGNWPDFNPRHTVLLEQAPANAETTSDVGGTARIVTYRNTEVVVAVDAPGGGFLLLHDVWHRWWRASVDGAPAPVLKANVLFRAVAIPPGAREVRFTFRPLLGLAEDMAARLAR